MKSAIGINSHTGQVLRLFYKRVLVLCHLTVSQAMTREDHQEVSDQLYAPRALSC